MYQTSGVHQETHTPAMSENPETLEGDAMTATNERDEDHAAMKAAIKPIKGTLKGALRKRPDLLAKLGL